jgi:hypothetical protein
MCVVNDFTALNPDAYKYDVLYSIEVSVSPLQSSSMTLTENSNRNQAFILPF